MGGGGLIEIVQRVVITWRKLQDASDDNSGYHHEWTCPQDNEEILKSPSAPPQEEGPTEVKTEQPPHLVPLSITVLYRNNYCRIVMTEATSEWTKLCLVSDFLSN